MGRYHWTWKALIGWVIVLSIAYSALSVIRHSRFESGGFDLGMYDQAVWQYSQFLSPYNTIKERFILGDHLTLTLALLAPLYWLWEDARILLLFQVFWLSLSSVAVYRLALFRLTREKRPRLMYQWVAIAISILYSLFPGIQYAVFSDFHPVIIGVGLLPWIAYFLETKREKLLVVSVLVLLLTQENMGIALAGLGLLYLFQKEFRRQAIIFATAGVLTSLVAVKVTASFSPIGFEYAPSIPGSVAHFITQLFDHPEKRHVWFSSLSWFSFLPLLSPGAMLAVTLDLTQYFATGSQLSRMWSPYMHHRAILGVFLVLGTLDGLHFIEDKVRKINLSKNAIARINKFIFSIVPIVLLASAMGQQYVFHLPLNKLTKREFWKEDQWMRDNQALIHLIPKDASVATQQNLVPHVSHRKEIYLVYPKLHEYDDLRCGRRSCWWLDFAGRPNYLVVDTRPDQWLTQILETNEHFSEAVANMEKAGKIRLEKTIGASRMYAVSY